MEYPPSAISNSPGLPALRTFLVSDEHPRERLDRYLTQHLPELSRSRIQAAIRSGGIMVNGQAAVPSMAIKAGDIVSFQEPETIKPDDTVAEDIPLEILYEDADLLVINKPPGMVVHPGAGNFQGTMVNALLHHCGSLSNIGGVERPGIVHRLDKETSGCVVVAKNDVTHQELSRQFADREIEKTYLAVVEGVPRKETGVIEIHITRHAVNRQKMTVSEAGKGRSALTNYKVLKSNGILSLVECNPKTGRTHQIRVHLKHLGHPIAGDHVYGKRGAFQRHLLHAWKLVFKHPRTGKKISMVSPVPEDFETAIDCKSLDGKAKKPRRKASPK